jgi:protein-disulfide isomerase
MKHMLRVIVLLLALSAGAIYAQEATEEAAELVDFEAVLADLPQARGADGAFILGDPDAPLTLIEFSDWRCPHCIDYRTTLEPFVAEYVADGRIAFEYRIFPTAGGVNTLAAGEYLECAENEQEGAFWNAFIPLYELGGGSEDTSDFTYTVESLPAFFEAQLGISAETLQTCRAAFEENESQVRVDMAFGSANDISGTPSLRLRYANGMISPVVTADGPVAAEGLQFTIDNFYASQEFLTANAQEDGVQVTESGLQYIINDAGSGDLPTEDSVVTVFYEGRFVDGTVFDTNVGGDAISFPVTGVIPGFAEGVQLIGAGGAITLFIPPELGYQALYAGNVIPPNSVLVFDVVLEAVE